MENATGVVRLQHLLTGTLQPQRRLSFIQLKDWDERPDAEDHAPKSARRLNAAFATRIKGGLAFAFGPPAIPGLGTGSGFTMMLQDRSGNAPEYLASRPRASCRRPTQRPRSPARSPCSVQRAADLSRHRRAKALKLGVPLADVNTSIGAFLGGAYVNDFNRFGRLYKVYVQAEPEYRTEPEGLRMFYVRNDEGDGAAVDAGHASRTAGPSSPTASTCSAAPR